MRIFWEISIMLILYSGISIGQDSLSLYIPDFQINENAGFSRKELIEITDSKNFNFNIFWRDERNGENEIYSQKFDIMGSHVEDNFYVSSSYYYSRTAIATDKDGNYLIAWQLENKLYLQKFNKQNIPITEQISFDNDQFEISPYTSPQISFRQDGTFIVAWIGKKRLYPSARIWGQKFYANCEKDNDFFTPFLKNHSAYAPKDFDLFILSDSNYAFTGKFDNNSFLQIYNNQRILESDLFLGSGTSFVGSQFDADNFLLAFIKDNNIFVRKYKNNGTQIGDSVQVNKNTNDSKRSYFDITTKQGYTFISWLEYNNLGYEIFAQILNPNFEPLFSDINITQMQISFQRPPIVKTTAIGKKRFSISYNRILDGFIYFSVIDEKGNFITHNKIANDDIGSENQTWSDISTSISSKIIAWTDLRNNKFDVYFRNFNSATDLNEENFIMLPFEDEIYFPSIAHLVNSQYLLTWTEDLVAEVHSQLIDSNGLLIGEPFLINDFANSSSGIGTKVASNSNGQAILVWKDIDNGQIYYQLLDSDLSKIGVNSLVSEYSNAPTIWFDCSINNESGFFICWQDYKSIRLKGYYGYDQQISDSYIINDDGLESVEYNFPRISLNKRTDNFVITWYDNRNGNFDIYAQLFDKNGTPVGNNFLVNDDISGADQLFPVVAIDSLDNIVIAWEDKRNGNSDVYAQVFLAGGIPWGKNFLVNQDTLRTQYQPAVDVDGNKIYFSWTTNHVGGTGFDIWTNAFEWDWTTGIEETENENIPFKMEIYPNPFNASTKIKYFIPRRTDVQIKIYDSLGREVTALVNQTKPRGKYEAYFNPNNLSSGVYFAVVSTGNKQMITKKIVYLK